MLLLQQLQFGYPQQTWRYDQTLDLQLSVGQMVVLLGRNGTGKSSLLHTIGGRLKPQQGTVLWQGQSVHARSATQAALQMAWATASERPDVEFMTVRDLVALGRYPHTGWWGKQTENDKNKIEWALQTVCISESLARQPIKKCSEGERQLASLARALAQDTPVILLDEATAHLDFVHRQNIFQHLQHIAHQHHKLILLATHELDLAAQYADTALCLMPPQWYWGDAAEAVKRLINTKH